MALSRPPIIELAHGNSDEALTRDLLIELFDTYPLDKWRYAERIRIESGVIPHSHPVPTLASHPDRLNPLRLLATYIHEQLHWFWLLEHHGDRRWLAWRSLREAFPNLPVDLPAGCGSEESNYLHVAITFWELLALEELVGDEIARAFLERKPYYTAISHLVLTTDEVISSILEQFDLIPPALPPEDKRFIIPTSPTPGKPFSREG